MMTSQSKSTLILCRRSRRRSYKLYISILSLCFGFFLLRFLFLIQLCDGQEPTLSSKEEFKLVSNRNRNINKQMKENNNKVLNLKEKESTLEREGQLLSQSHGTQIDQNTNVSSDSEIPSSTSVYTYETFDIEGDGQFNSKRQVICDIMSKQYIDSTPISYYLEVAVPLGEILLPERCPIHVVVGPGHLPEIIHYIYKGHLSTNDYAMKYNESMINLQKSEHQQKKKKSALPDQNEHTSQRLHYHNDENEIHLNRINSNTEKKPFQALFINARGIYALMLATQLYASNLPTYSVTWKIVPNLHQKEYLQEFEYYKSKWEKARGHTRLNIDIIYQWPTTTSLYDYIDYNYMTPSMNLFTDIQYIFDLLKPEGGIGMTVASKGSVNKDRLKTIKRILKDANRNKEINLQSKVDKTKYVKQISHSSLNIMSTHKKASAKNNEKEIDYFLYGSAISDLCGQKAGYGGSHIHTDFTFFLNNFANLHSNQFMTLVEVRDEINRALLVSANIENASYNDSNKENKGKDALKKESFNYELKFVGVPNRAKYDPIFLLHTPWIEETEKIFDFNEKEWIYKMIEPDDILRYSYIDELTGGHNFQHEIYFKKVEKKQASDSRTDNMNHIYSSNTEGRKFGIFDFFSNPFGNEIDSPRNNITNNNVNVSITVNEHLKRQKSIHSFLDLRKIFDPNEWSIDGLYDVQNIKSSELRFQGRCLQSRDLRAVKPPYGKWENLWIEKDQIFLYHDVFIDDVSSDGGVKSQEKYKRHWTMTIPGNKFVPHLMQALELKSTEIAELYTHIAQEYQLYEIQKHNSEEVNLVHVDLEELDLAVNQFLYFMVALGYVTFTGGKDSVKLELGEKDFPYRHLPPSSLSDVNMKDNKATSNSKAEGEGPRSTFDAKKKSHSQDAAEDEALRRHNTFILVHSLSTSVLIDSAQGLIDVLNIHGYKNCLLVDETWRPFHMEMIMREMLTIRDHDSLHFDSLKESAQLGKRGNPLQKEYKKLENDERSHMDFTTIYKRKTLELYNKDIYSGDVQYNLRDDSSPNAFTPKYTNSMIIQRERNFESRRNATMTEEAFLSTEEKILNKHYNYTFHFKETFVDLNIIHVVIGPHFLSVLPPAYVVYQAEVLDSLVLRQYGYEKYLKEATCIWDMSIKQVNHLLQRKDFLTPTVWLPMYTPFTCDQNYNYNISYPSLSNTFLDFRAPSLHSPSSCKMQVPYVNHNPVVHSNSRSQTNHTSSTEYPFGKDIDVLFFGGGSPRRKSIHREIKEWAKDNNLNVLFFFNRDCNGYFRDDLIRRSKIVLNIHSFPDRPLEVHRLNHLLLLGEACVVSEFSSDTVLDEIHDDSVFFVDLENMIPALSQILIDYDEKKNYIQGNGKSFCDIKKENGRRLVTDFQSDPDPLESAISLAIRETLAYKKQN